MYRTGIGWDLHTIYQYCMKQGGELAKALGR